MSPSDDIWKKVHQINNTKKELHKGKKKSKLCQDYDEVVRAHHMEVSLQSYVHSLSTIQHCLVCFRPQGNLLHNEAKLENNHKLHRINPISHVVSYSRTGQVVFQHHIMRARRGSETGDFSAVALHDTNRT